MDSVSVFRDDLWDDVDAGDSLLSQLVVLASALRAARREDLESHAAADYQDDVFYIGETAYYWPGVHDQQRYFFDLSPTEESLLDSFCDSHDGTLVDWGTGRVVLTHPSFSDYVVKVSRWGPTIANGDGMKQNAFEQHIFQQYGENLSPPLCPIVAAHGSDWVLQPRAEPLEEILERNPALAHRGRRRVQRQADTLTDTVHFEDFSFENLGRWNDDWYVLDYGRPNEDPPAPSEIVPLL